MATVHKTRCKVVEDPQRKPSPPLLYSQRPMFWPAAGRAANLSPPVLESPQELVKQASLAARLQDLDIIRLEAGTERREPAQWDELRVWDPGDG